MADLLAFLLDLYDPQTARVVNRRLEALLAAYRPIAAPDTRTLDQRDALLITYADQIHAPGQPPLQTLDVFARHHLRGLVSGLHILPFFPYTSDDGFSVVDYRQVDPGLGSWADVQRLEEQFLLMVDAVINHISAGSAWFQAFLRGEPPYNDYFLSIPADTDLTRVVRPRALPLLTPFETTRGRQHVWTTFSADQVDLNFHNPDLLLDVLSILLEYAARGARFLRLDAIAYLWKIPGTTCIHLPQTHRFIQLLRAVLDRVAPHVLLVTETNVPHADNISYFGSGSNEAQMVYNFALPPLALHTFASANVSALHDWAAGLRRSSDRATFFNFLASHDGIGINPARDILSSVDIERMLDRGLKHGGRISCKTNPDGSQSAYELNINYFDALSNPAGGEPLELQARRFLAAQSIPLVLAGLPGIYAHSLIGSRNWQAGVQQTGRSRSINRQKLSLDILEQELAAPGLRRMVFEGYARLLRARAQSPAFHPFGHQKILDAGSAVFALLRTNPEGSRPALCLVNVTPVPQQVQVELPSGLWRDLLSGRAADFGALTSIHLEGYQSAWFVPVSGE